MPYMYTTAAKEVEANRLKGLNALHNPHTSSYIKRYLPRQKILELGCGSGLLAVDVLANCPPTTTYLGVDKDPGQVAWSQKNLHSFPKAEILQLDFLENFSLLKSKGPFDLIYCRWVLVHLPKEKLVTVLKNIIDLLAPGGIFLCDECDNREVKFQPKNGRFSNSQYQKATEDWLSLSQSLMKTLGNDLELTSQKIADLLSEATQGRGEIKIEGQYQVNFETYDHKRFITDGYRSAAEFIKKASGKDVEIDIIPTSDQCAKDDNIEVKFLQESVISYKK